MSFVRYMLTRTIGTQLHFDRGYTFAGFGVRASFDFEFEYRRAMPMAMAMGSTTDKSWPGTGDARPTLATAKAELGSVRPSVAEPEGLNKSDRRLSLTLNDYDVYGFDVDHTLAQYDIPKLFDLVHNSFAKYLVEKKGYHKDLQEPFHKYKDFCTRGLVLDIKHGNFLKVAEDGTIFRASHGTHFLSDADIRKRYKGRHWPRSDELINKVDNIGGKEVMIFDNFFDMMGTVMIARIIDIVDREASGPQDDYTNHWEAVMGAYTDAYHYQAFSGGFFPYITKEPEKYIKPCSEEVKKWLKCLRRDGKATFFMTSSNIDFATHSLQFILGLDWQSYFDIGVTRARKPGFFFNNRPFLRLSEMSEKEPVQKLEQGRIYSQGNNKEFEKFLTHLTGKEHPKVLYFGDSNRSDVYPSRCYAGWDTCAVIEEVEAEISPEEFEVNISRAPSTKKRKVEGPDDETKEYLSSSGWGSFFTDTLQGSSKDETDSAVKETLDKHDANLHSSTTTETKIGQRREEVNQPDATSTDISTLDCSEGSERTSLNTMWGHIIKKYACIAVPSLQHLTELPHDSPLEMFDHRVPNQWGFHPNPPAALSSPRKGDNH